MKVLDRLGVSIGDLSTLAMRYTMRQAACKLGMGMTLLKSECRRLKLHHWPYRSIVATRNILKSRNISAADKERIRNMLRKFESDPIGTNLCPTWVINLRVKNYKQRFRKNGQDLSESSDSCSIEINRWYLLIDASKSEFDVPFFVPCVAGFSAGFPHPSLHYPPYLRPSHQV